MLICVLDVNALSCELGFSGCFSFSFKETISDMTFCNFRLLDVTTCVDIDECKEDNGGCVGECENKPGTYTCKELQ